MSRKIWPAIRDYFGDFGNRTRHFTGVCVGRSIRKAASGAA
jgi:hypothetical protein